MDSKPFCTFGRLLRILSLEEIGLLTRSFASDKKVSLTAIMEEEDQLPLIAHSWSGQKQQTAKIINLKRKVEQSLYQCGPEVLELLGDPTESAVEELESDEKKTEVCDFEGDSASAFILNQKHHLQRSQARLKEKEVRKLYAVFSNKGKKSDAATTEEDRKQESHIGVLINKKQA